MVNGSRTRLNCRKGATAVNEAVLAAVALVPSDDLSRVVDVINVGVDGAREVESGVRALSVEEAMKT